MINCDKVVFTGLSADMLSRGVSVRFRAAGSSMYPLIRDGDVLVVERTDPEKIRYGDIIFFIDAAGRTVVHRAIKIRAHDSGTTLTTRGDSTLADDAPIDGRDVIGRVAWIEKGNGRLNVGNGMGRILSALYTVFIPFSKWSYIILSAPFRRQSVTLADNGKAPGNAPRGDRDGYYKAAARNAIIYEEAGRVVRAFNDSAIRTIMLKGIFLAEHVYRNIALRPMSDIDILIKKEDLARANETLARLGYTAPERFGVFLRNEEISPINSLMYFAADRRRPCVHLHWHLINSTWPVEDLVSGIDSGSIWQEAVTTTVSGVETLALGPEHLLMHLAHHGLHHSFDKPSMVTDITETIKAYGKEIDWVKVAGEAGRSGLGFPIYASLVCVSKRSGLDIPEIDALRPDNMGILQKAVLRRIEDGRCSYLISYCAYLSAQRGGFSKARFIFRTILPSRLVLSHNMRLPVSCTGISAYFKRLFG